MRRTSHEIIMIGHRGHPEVEGTMGQAQGGMYLVENLADVARLQVEQPDRLAYVTQTTLSMDDAASIVGALKTRFPSITGPKKDDICYATQNRQDAVKLLAAQCDVVVVVGSPNSSNSNRLREVAQHLEVAAYLVDQADQMDPAWFTGKLSVGVTAGASAPELLVEQVIERLKSWGVGEVRQVVGVLESTTFPLPKELARTQDGGKRPST